MFFRSCFSAVVFLASTVVSQAGGAESAPLPARIIISVRDQKLMVVENGQRAGVYPISTSRFGIGDRWGSMATPLGWLQVAQKIGDHAPTGAVFHNRRFTGEILRPNAPGRDPIVTRIIWLRGLQRENANAYNRGIYIHGTPQEKAIGKPASYGCVRMCSKDVTEVYSQLQIGQLVCITPDSLPKLPKFNGSPSRAIFTAQAPDRKPSDPARKTVEKSNSKQKRVSTLVATSGHSA
ncbi:MAG TPA: L,D-transpeptidase [Chthoniobacterales bacterium]|jgi:lipoprotein-anchoring transpeptidase ErfK/SrfK